MNNQGNSVLHMLARQTGRKYEDLYAEHHGTMRFWGDAELTAKQIARIQSIRAERAERRVVRREGCLSDEGEMLYTVLTIEDQERERRAKFGECGEIGNQIIEYYKNLRRSRSLTEGLNARQIARIERIRAERAAKKAAPDCCHTCGDISDEYTCRDGKLYCDGCEAVRHNNITDWCESLNVDDRDSPNVFPYKKCGSCHERSSCGNYTNDGVWLCEDCGFCDY